MSPSNNSGATLSREGSFSPAEPLRGFAEPTGKALSPFWPWLPYAVGNLRRLAIFWRGFHVAGAYIPVLLVLTLIVVVPNLFTGHRTV